MWLFMTCGIIKISYFTKINTQVLVAVMTPLFFDDDLLVFQG